VPVAPRPEGLSVILTRRADTLTSHTGQIALPGGRLDPGEGPVEAAVREAFEEIALAPDAVEPLGLSPRYETVTGYAITPVLALVDREASYEANPDEVAEVFEAPFDLVTDPAHHERRFYETSDGHRRWFYAVPVGERLIWGATAGLLRALGERLRDQAPAVRSA
jgi:8-oxo-dGTP pyrophosphatase MutT (NUDIX family)